jgi:hypothetical protein
MVHPQKSKRNGSFCFLIFAHNVYFFSFLLMLLQNIN